MAGSCSKETKAKIREKLVGVWEKKRKIKEGQGRCVRNWQEMIAEAARLGEPGEEEYDWDSYRNIKQQYRLEERLQKEAAKVKVKGPRKKKVISDAHRKAISDAIRAKWTDPAYQANVSAGMARIDADSRRRRSAGTKSRTLESAGMARIDADCRQRRSVETKSRTLESAGMARIDADCRQRRSAETKSRVLESSKRRVAGNKSRRTVANAEESQVEKKKPVQVLEVDENFIAAVLAEDVTLQTRSERSTAARIQGPRKVTLVSLEDHNLSSKDVNEAASEDKNVEQEEVVSLEGWKTTEDTEDLKTLKGPSLRPEDVQLSSKLRSSKSYKDPFVLEKVQRIQQLRKGRLEVDLKRKEAADRARKLIADAERAASALEQAGSVDPATMAKLLETRRLLTEARRSMQAAEMKQGASLGKSRNSVTQENEKPLSLATSGDFHSRLWSAGDNIADCPHPIPMRIGRMRSKEEHQLRLDQLGGNVGSSSSRSSRWATSRSDLVEEKTQSSMASDTEESQAGSTEEPQNSKDGLNSLAGRGSSNPSNRSKKKVWHRGLLREVDEDERT